MKVNFPNNFCINAWYRGDRKICVVQSDDKATIMSNNDKLTKNGNDIFLNGHLLTNMPDINAEDLARIYKYCLRKKGYKIFENAQTDSFLYRNTSQQWLINLLQHGSIQTLGKKFISLSLQPDSGGQDHYGNCHIVFNADLLYKQGAIEIVYDEPQFWQQHPKIAKHVTGFNSAKDYYNNKDYAGPEDANDNSDFTWEQYCENYSDEQEVVIEKITMVPNLIQKVIISEKPTEQLLKLLQFKYNIYFEIENDDNNN